jgi:hypothetical protein
MSFQQELSERNNKPRAMKIAGYSCNVRRSSLNAWIAAGLVPQDLVNELASHAPDAANDDAAEMDQAQAIALGQRLQQLKIELSVTTSEGSRFTFTDEPGKVSVFDLEDPDAFIREALAAIEALPIPTVNGDLPADALASFRADGDRAAESGSVGIHSQPVRESPVKPAWGALPRNGA